MKRLATLLMTAALVITGIFSLGSTSEARALSEDVHSPFYSPKVKVSKTAVAPGETFTYTVTWKIHKLGVDIGKDLTNVPETIQGMDEYWTSAYFYCDFSNKAFVPVSLRLYDDKGNKGQTVTKAFRGYNYDLEETFDKEFLNNTSRISYAGYPVKNESFDVCAYIDHDPGAADLYTIVLSDGAQVLPMLGQTITVEVKCKAVGKINSWDFQMLQPPHIGLIPSNSNKVSVKLQAPANSQFVYRLYNKKTKEHLYTASYNEYSVLPKYGWTQEGIGWNAPKKGKGVYRLYNPRTKDHHYTVSTNEAKVLTTKYGWKYDNNKKPIFYSGGKTPIYRLYNKKLKQGSHHFTKDVNEYKKLPSYGWKQEGVAFYSN